MVGNIIMMAIGMVMMGVGASMVPTMIAGFNTARYGPTSSNLVNFTGLDNVLSVGPTIIVLGFIISGAVVGFLGIKGIMGK